MNTVLNVPAHVRALEFDDLLVLLNTHTGHIEALDATGIRLWAALADTRDKQVAARTACLPPPAVAATVDKLLDGGFLSLGRARDRWLTPVAGRLSEPGWGTGTVVMCLEKQEPGSLTSRFAAAIAVGITLLTRHASLKKGSFGRLLRLANTAAALTRRPATHGETAEAVRAVRHIARWWPARIACLEESIAASIWLTVHNRRATWCHGIAPDPVRLHAWLAVDGEPVAEPDSTAAYTPLIEVGATSPIPEAPTYG